MTPTDAVERLRDMLTGHYRIAALANRAPGTWVPVEISCLEALLGSAPVRSMGVEEAERKREAETVGPRAADEAGRPRLGVMTPARTNGVVGSERLTSVVPTDSNAGGGGPGVPTLGAASSFPLAAPSSAPSDITVPTADWHQPSVFPDLTPPTGREISGSDYADDDWESLMTENE